MKILQILKINPNEEITTEDFIESYLKLEEKIKINNLKYEKALDELSESISRNQELLQKYESEIELENGLTDKSTLFITVIDAVDLKSGSFFGGINPYVSLKFQGETQETNVKSGSNPKWYELFNFKINSPTGELRVEVYDKGMWRNKCIGYLQISLNDLINQEKKMKEYELFNEKNINCGKIYLKLHCIINFRQFYQGEILKMKNDIEIIKEAFELSTDYVEEMQKPFGVILAEDIDSLIYESQFQKADELIKILEKNKESIYNKKDGVKNTDSIVNKNGKIVYNTLTKVLIYCLIFFSIASLLERSDFVNLSISGIIYYLFIFDDSGLIIKYLTSFIYLIGAAITFDLIWLITTFTNFFVGEEIDPESSLKRLVYLFSICGTVIKFFFIYALLSLRKKNLNLN